MRKRRPSAAGATDESNTHVHTREPFSHNFLFWNQISNLALRLHSGPCSWPLGFPPPIQRLHPGSVFLARCTTRPSLMNAISSNVSNTTVVTALSTGSRVMSGYCEERRSAMASGRTKRNHAPSGQSLGDSGLLRSTLTWGDTSGVGSPANLNRTDPPIPTVTLNSHRVLCHRLTHRQQCGSELDSCFCLGRG